MCRSARWTAVLIGAFLAFAVQTQAAEPVLIVQYVGIGDRMTDESRRAFDAFADTLVARPQQLRLEVYAGAPDMGETRARQRALRRGVAMRNALIASGVPARLISLHVAGPADPGAPSERVDLFLVTE